jgi:CRISPR-associated endonuclease Csy4
MKYYLDITLLPDAEANLGFLWKKVYQQIHLALVENKEADGSSAIAISIPEYGSKQFLLGKKLRLFSQDREQFQQLDIARWLSRLTDYTHYTSIKDVPSNIKQFAYFKRKQFDTNIERLARRRARRKGESFEQALSYLKDFKDRETNLPFINMKSLSGEAQFRLFIEQSFVDAPSVGEFNCYGLSSNGLSKTATIPWF